MENNDIKGKKLTHFARWPQCSTLSPATIGSLVIELLQIFKSSPFGLFVNIFKSILTTQQLCHQPPKFKLHPYTLIPDQMHNNSHSCAKYYNHHQYTQNLYILFIFMIQFYKFLLGLLFIYFIIYLSELIHSIKFFITNTYI